MKKNKIFCSALIYVICSIFLLNMSIVGYAQEANCIDLISTMVNSIQEKDWDAFTNLMSLEEQEFYEWYFENDSYTNGIKQIQSIKLNQIYPLNYQQVESELLYDAYPILLTNTQIKSYVVELECEVTEESIYFHNGINYYLLVFIKEANEYKLIQFNQPTYEFLKGIIESKMDTKNKDYSERIAALEIVNYAEHGLLVDSQGKVIISDEYTIWRKNKVTGELVNYSEQMKKGIKERANNYSDHPALDNTYLYYSIPSNVTVRLDRTGNNEVVSPTLEDYIKNTLPNEIYTSWQTEALVANAYCVKGVGIYRSIKPINANYMVTQYTQFYKPNSAVQVTNAIADSINNYFMVNSDFKFFFPEYGAGTAGVAGTAGSGRLLQYGTQYLASQLGYTYTQILNYYYEGSDCSASSLYFISYGSVIKDGVVDK